MSEHCSWSKNIKIKFFIHDYLLQPLHLEVINESYMHSVPKSEHNRTAQESSSYSSLGLLNLTLGRECIIQSALQTPKNCFGDLGMRLPVQPLFLPLTMSLSSLSIHRLRDTLQGGGGVGNF